ncbi:hypothetical protein CCHL11_03640 [Colletotrichum chlorophyti]|uniref:Bromo domain-containing protein n=1 Tax=Colletotrichum chlorophyti TaxID=708187 RepID=A0A1Q8RSG0_9PEZI|nr:hypothetical protein CCHL11_03640 [Colletotrichum chlorophyti]
MQTLAPIHLLPRRDGPLDRWRGGYWGMNHPTIYTPLESLFLFQSVLRHGIEAAAFATISDELTNNPLIKDDKTYDAGRLNPDALRNLFLHLLQEEVKSGNANPDKSDGVLSPNSKKRKLSRPPLPTLKEVKEQFHKLPVLVDRLYARYQNLVVEEVRKDERELERLAKEIGELEAQELAERAKVTASRPATTNNTPVPKATPTPVPVPVPIPSSAQPQTKPPTPTPPTETLRQIRPANGQSSASTQTPVPVPTPVPLPPQAHVRSTPAPTSASPAPQPVTARRDGPSASAFQSSPAGPPAQAVSSAGAPGPTQVTAPAQKQYQPAKPPNGTGQVLQPPVGAGQPPVRPGQSTSPVPLPAISPRPDNLPKSRPPGPATPVQPSTPGTLKWEKPYQPALPASQSQGRPVPPQIPTTSAPSTPGQPHHPSQWYPQPTGQYHGPPQPPHVPIQPNQAQRYSQQSQPVLVPPQPQPQSQTQSQPRVQSHAQSQTQASAHAQSQPQAKGQLVAPMHSTPVKGQSEASAVAPPQGRPLSTTPIMPPKRPHYPQPQQPQQQQQQAHAPAPHPTNPPQSSTGYQHTSHQRPLAAASPTPSSAPPGQTIVPPPKWPQSYPSPYAQQQFSPSPAPSQPLAKPADNQRRVSSPLNKQQPRPAIPPHLAPHVTSTPPPPQRAASTPIPPPQTPTATAPTHFVTGTGTKWTLKSTPSTPRPSGREVASPAFEPLSPVQQPAPLSVPTPSQAPKKASPRPLPATIPALTSTPAPAPALKSEAKTPRGRGRPPRNANKVRADSTPSSVIGPSRRSQSVVSQTDELSMDHHELAPRIKDENATPRATPQATPKPQDETGDTTADESVPSRKTMITPSSVSARLGHKRKRQETPTEPPAAPTHVLWTRQFGRVSAAALDQISAHRFANQFANPIRERDAPGYKTLILQPQDIKSIRAAITHGNRAATEAAKALPDGDPGTGSVLLPISEDLVPPKSIINSAQLERELVHMFSNAIMYNLNPSRGPGPAFMKGGSAGDGGDVLGYEVDEDAVVRSTRMMSMEVEKIIGELRNAEKQRTGQAPSNSGNTRPASVATGEDTPMAEDDVDELAGDADMASTTRRRRVGTRN